MAEDVLPELLKLISQLQSELTAVKSELTAVKSQLAEQAIAAAALKAAGVAARAAARAARAADVFAKKADMSPEILSFKEKGDGLNKYFAKIKSPHIVVVNEDRVRFIHEDHKDNLERFYDQCLGVKCLGVKIRIRFELITNSDCCHKKITTSIGKTRYWFIRLDFFSNLFLNEMFHKDTTLCCGNIYQLLEYFEKYTEGLKFEFKIKRKYAGMPYALRNKISEIMRFCNDVYSNMNDNDIIHPDERFSDEIKIGHQIMDDDLSYELKFI